VQLWEGGRVGGREGGREGEMDEFSEQKVKTWREAETPPVLPTSSPLGTTAWISSRVESAARTVAASGGSRSRERKVEGWERREKEEEEGREEEEEEEEEENMVII